MAETLAYGRCLRLRSHARGGLSWRHKTRGTRRQSCEQSVLFQSVLSRPRCWQRTPTLQVIVGVRSLPSEARTAVMRRSISAGPRCWHLGAGADRIRFPARRLGPAAPGRPVRHARTDADIRNQTTCLDTPFGSVSSFSSADYCERGKCVPAMFGVGVAPAHEEPRSGSNNSAHEPTSGRSTNYGSGHLIRVFRDIERIFS